jgi:type IV secretory pathway TraG/TraD family ATPase VirD4
MIQKRFEQAWVAKGLVKPKKGVQKFSDDFLKSSTTLYVPDAQRGISVCGAAGSGKTFSVIDPLIRSSLDQGFPTIVYDFKYPAQTKRAVAYAMKRGYTVRVFAPGFPESEICNPLDLLRDEEDAVAAGQLAQVINKNFDRGGGDSGDKFFQEAGDSLVEGILLVTKAVGRLTGDPRYCDLMMAQAVLSLDSLPQRLEAASKNGTLKVWTSRPLSQLISVKDSEKTVAGILGTAQRIFQRFLKKDFVGAFCGQTTLPLDLDSKQQRHLLEPSEFLKLGTGRAVIVNPAYVRARESYVPLLQAIKVPKGDIDEMNWSESKWDVIRPKLIERNHSSVTDEMRSQQFEERRALAEKLFPLPQSNPTPPVELPPTDEQSSFKEEALPTFF